ncbi:MAG: hypothetical protein ACJ76H_13865 [Bacteriovoracaceae bacterium]
MKSSFVLTFVLTVLLGTNAWAQGTRTRTRTKKAAKPKQTKTTPAAKPAKVAKPTAAPKPAKPITGSLTTTTTTATSTQPVATDSVEKKTDFQKFYDRVSISYWGQATSPNLKKWSSKNAALSPQIGDERLDKQDTRRCAKNCDTYAANLWSQLNFGYDFGWKMKFNIIPRWVTYLGSPRDMQRANGEDRAMLGLEDFLIAFSGVIVSSEDKKFNWFFRPGVRLPTSHFSRHNTNPAFGDLTSNTEMSSYITYDVNPTLQFGLNAQQRMWVFEDRYNPSRLRFYTAPYISITLNDKTKFQWYYQNMIENNKRWHTIGDKKPSTFKDIYQDTFLGITRDVTDRLNVFPYIGVFVDDIPLSMRSAYLGAWISYRIK